MDRENLTKEVIDKLQEQIVHEENSEKMYYAIANWMKYNGFIGCQKLYNYFAEQKKSCADLSYKYLQDMDIMPDVSNLDKPTKEYEDIEIILQETYEHEIETTDKYNELAEVCLKENDYLTFTFVQQYLVIQREKIGEMSLLLDKVKLYKESIVKMDEYVEGFIKNKLNEEK